MFLASLSALVSATTTGVSRSASHGHEVELLVLHAAPDVDQQQHAGERSCARRGSASISGRQLSRIALADLGVAVAGQIDEEERRFGSIANQLTSRVRPGVRDVRASPSTGRPAR